MSLGVAREHQRRRDLLDPAAAETHAKKKSLTASEQSRPDVQEARANFFTEQLKALPLADVVVLNESYATTTFTRQRGRCPVHRRLPQHVPAGHWKRLSILAAISAAGVLCAASVDAATDADVFRGFVTDCLVPTLRLGMLVVMDNLSAHKVAGVREAVEACVVGWSTCRPIHRIRVRSKTSGPRPSR